MKILGIDPGYERVGIAVIEKSAKQKEELLYSDCFQTPAKLPFPERLRMIGEELENVIETHKPDALSIETLFFNSNQKTAIMVAEARGVVLFEAAKKNLEIYEYNPLQIKIAVTGYGRSDKKQVTSMIERLVSVKKEIKHDDEYDAIAVALTCSACYKQLK